MLIIMLSIFCTKLSTDSLYNIFEIGLFVNIKKYISNIYIIIFVIEILMIINYVTKNKCNLNRVIMLIVKAIIFLPISILLIYNFLLLESLMSSFYLLVVFVVVLYITKFLFLKIV